MQIQLTGNRLENLDALDNAFQNGNGYQAITDIIAVQRMVGVVLAKALYLGSFHWDNHDESFLDYAMHEWGYTKATIQRYIHVWEAILDAPEELQDKLVAKDMKSLVPIGTNVANGSIEPDEDDWHEFIETADHMEVSSLIREMTGREQKDRISLEMDKDGNLNAWYKNEPYYVGFLDVHARDKEPIDKAINRILNKTGIKEK